MPFSNTLYASLSDSGPGATTRDLISGFTSADKLNVATIDANKGVAGNQAFRLDVGGVFAAGEIRHTVVGSNLFLDFNADSDAAAEMQIVLLGRTTALGGADFVL